MCFTMWLFVWEASLSKEDLCHVGPAVSKNEILCYRHIDGKTNILLLLQKAYWKYEYFQGILYLVRFTEKDVFGWERLRYKGLVSHWDLEWSNSVITVLYVCISNGYYVV